MLKIKKRHKKKSEGDVNNDRRVKNIEEIMSTTEIGEIIVLMETEKNTYLRTKHGLRRICSEIINIETVSIPRHQSR